MPGGQLFDRRLLIGKGVVAQIEIAIAVICLRPLGRAAAMADLHNDETELSELLIGAVSAKRVRNPLLLRARINVSDDRVFFLWIEIKRLPHVAVEIGHAVGGLDAECLRQLPAGSFESGE